MPSRPGITLAAGAIERYPNLVAVPTPINRIVLATYGDSATLAAKSRAEVATLPWPHAWASEAAFLVLNRRHAALVAPLDAALQQMTREGLVERFYDEGLRRLKIAPLPVDDDPVKTPGPRR